MAVQFVLGGSGTGKTTFLLEEIREKIAAGETAPMYYLVPEQFSLQSERLLLDGEREAATQVQVLSFNRLAYRLFAALGFPQGKHADDLGKQMLLRKVLFEVSAELEYYRTSAEIGTNQGFVAELVTTITELNHYRVSADDLRDRADLSTPMFAAKLRDVALILQKYRAATRDRFLLTDETPELLSQKLAEIPPNTPLPLLDNAFFWVDGFSGFTPQERYVLLHIFKRATKVVLAFTTGGAGGRGYLDFANNRSISNVPCPPPVRDTMEKIIKLVGDARVEIVPPICLQENLRHIKGSDLQRFVMGNDQRSNRACIASLNNISTAAPDVDNSIEVIRAADRYTAVYATAERVIELVEGGYEFRDIAILCGDRGKYEKILQNVFDRKGIPVFVDTEIDILSHPLTELVRAALEIVVKGWGFDGVFRFLKTRLTKVAQETIDTMENYALANGVFLPNTYRHRYPLKCEVAESGRLQLLDAMKPFEKKRGDSKDTVKNHAKRVFEMLYGLDVPGVLLKWYDAQMQNGDPETARLHGQIWPKLCEVFDKLVEILGDEKVTLKTFAATLDAGLCQVGLGRIPPTTNQIVLGDIGRSRYPKIHAMLVLGANEGVLMPTPTQSGLLTDYERKILRNSGTEIAPDNLLRVSEMNYNLQNALAQPSERLIFIYAEAEPSGKPLKPAQIIGQIKKAFPAVKTTAAASVSEFPAEGSVFFEPLNLSTETTNELYGKTIFTAATRLEAFAKCPFAYFMNYVLRARPRKQYEVLPADLGSLFHDVIADFTKQAGDFNLPREKVNFMINELIDGLELEDSIFHGTARNKYILEKVRRVAAASCYALCQQMRNNEYKPVMVEHEIHAKIPIANGKTLALTGRVDRVDISDLEKIKIIDYKTGSTKFSQKDALLGVQLQLPLYMNAITAARKNSTPGGIFYFPISDPIINTDIVLENAIREEKLLKEFKLSGIEVADFTKSGQMDAEAFAEFSRGIEATAKNLGNRLASGEIIAAPFAKGDNSPCRYCPHGGVCAK